MNEKDMKQKKFKWSTFKIAIFGIYRVEKCQNKRIMKAHHKLCKLEEKQNKRKEKLEFYKEYRRSYENHLIFTVIKES